MYVGQSATKVLTYLSSRKSALLFLKDMVKRRTKRTRTKNKTRRTMIRSARMMILLSNPRKVLPKRPRWRKKSRNQQLIKHLQSLKSYMYNNPSPFTYTTFRFTLHRHPNTLAFNDLVLFIFLTCRCCGQWQSKTC